MGVALALVGAGAALLPGAYDEPLTSSAVGRAAPVNRGAPALTDISSHNSPTLVRSPRDERRLAIANPIDTPRYSCALHVSSDAGATWSQTPVRAPPGETECYAPDAAFDADGTLYLSFVTLRGGGHVPNAVDRQLEGRWKDLVRARGQPYPGSWQLVISRSHAARPGGRRLGA